MNKEAHEATQVMITFVFVPKEYMPLYHGREVLVKEEEFFKNSVDGYILPSYSCNFNHITDKLKEVLPPSDTRFRPDQKEYEIGSTEKSQEIKKTIEEMQVYKQEILEKDNKEYQPIYFSNEYNEESKDFVFMYKGGYWEDRANKKLKLKNIFVI